MPELVNDVRTAQNVVTSENRAEFMAKRLDLSTPAEKVVTPDTKTPAAETKIADVKVDPKADDKTEGAEPAPKKEVPIQERFGKMAEQRRAAEARATAAEEARSKAERELQELKSKAAPAEPEPKPDELEAKPTREKFATDAEYTDALIAHAIKKDRIEQAEVAAQAKEVAARNKVLADWQTRLAKTREELPDYQEKIDAASGVAFSDQVRDAILESEVGPQILYYFAEPEHQHEAEELRGLSAIAAVRRIGRLEAELTAGKKTATTTPQREEKREAHVSKAPAPISALKASSAPENLVDASGKFKGDYKQFKALRREGKI